MHETTLLVFTRTWRRGTSTSSLTDGSRRRSGLGLGLSSDNDTVAYRESEGRVVHCCSAPRLPELAGSAARRSRRDVTSLARRGRCGPDGCSRKARRHPVRARILTRSIIRVQWSGADEIGPRAAGVHFVVLPTGDDFHRNGSRWTGATWRQDPCLSRGREEGFNSASTTHRQNYLVPRVATARSRSRSCEGCPTPFGVRHLCGYTLRPDDGIELPSLAEARRIATPSP